MRKLMAKHAERVERESHITSKSVALYKESKNDHNHDLKKLDHDKEPPKKQRIMIGCLGNESDPDGLSSRIKGQYAPLLKADPLYLKARAWKVHPGILTDATKRLGADAVRQEIKFVAGKPGISNPGAYLRKLLMA